MVISPNGNYTFTPAPGFTGTTQYVVSVCNNSVTPPICKNDTININVIPGLNPETMTLTAGSNVTGNVLSNEPSGIQNGTVTTTPISGPHHGVITITPNGNFTYTPTNPNYSGYDTVQVTICVGTVCATNTIMITVYPNLGNDSGSITPGGSTVTGNVLDNDHGTGLTVNSIPTTNPIGGTVVLNPNGTYVYTPNQNYCGVDSFAYQACDNSVPVLCKTAWVHITIPCEDVVSVPEGFSPNADGVNDVLVVKGISKYPDNKIVIFNRWGNVVFEGNADLNKWDGKSNAGTKIGGDDLPVGTYFYILDLKTTGKKNLKGYIYLQR
jgi:gliding motility-associated-like protein